MLDKCTLCLLCRTSQNHKKTLRGGASLAKAKTWRVLTGHGPRLGASCPSNLRSMARPDRSLARLLCVMTSHFVGDDAS